MSNKPTTLAEVLKKTPTFIVVMQGCGFCTRAIAAIPQAALYDHEEYPQLSQEIYEKYNHRTYPKIFVDGKFVGGFSDFQGRDGL